MITKIIVRYFLQMLRDLIDTYTDEHPEANQMELDALYGYITRKVSEP